jgi:hypothetical protein
MSDTSLDLFEGIDTKTLLALLDSLPVDVSFVNADDEVVYFNLPRDGRIFTRTRLDIGRRVQRCHPPQSVAKVQRILDDFRSKKRSSADFWLNLGDKFVYIRYFAVYAADGTYEGTLEVTQDCTGIRALQGQKKLENDETA